MYLHISTNTTAGAIEVRWLFHSTEPFISSEKKKRKSYLLIGPFLY